MFLTTFISKDSLGCYTDGYIIKETREEALAEISSNEDWENVNLIEIKIISEERIK